MMRYLSFVLFMPAALCEELQNGLQRLILYTYIKATVVSCVVKCEDVREVSQENKNIKSQSVE